MRNKEGKQQCFVGSLALSCIGNTSICTDRCRFFVAFVVAVQGIDCIVYTGAGAAL